MNAGCSWQEYKHYTSGEATYTNLSHLITLHWCRQLSCHCFNASNNAETSPGAIIEELSLWSWSHELCSQHAVANILQSPDFRKIMKVKDVSNMKKETRSNVIPHFLLINDWLNEWEVKTVGETACWWKIEAWLINDLQSSCPRCVNTGEWELSTFSQDSDQH